MKNIREIRHDGRVGVERKGSGNFLNLELKILK